MSRERTEEIRDELLIEMARGIQFLLAQSDAESLCLPRRHTIIGRVESHIEMLRKATLTRS
jgi:hypothetical protein